MHKLQCIQNTLGRIVTNCNRCSQAGPILKNSIDCQLNLDVFLKKPLWFISLFTVVTQTISALICLFIAEGVTQDTTAQILIFCTQIKKTHFGYSFAPTLWNDLPDDVRSALTLF